MVGSTCRLLVEEKTVSCYWDCAGRKACGTCKYRTNYSSLVLDINSRHEVCELTGIMFIACCLDSVHECVNDVCVLNSTTTTTTTNTTPSPPTNSSIALPTGICLWPPGTTIVVFPPPNNKWETTERVGLIVGIVTAVITILGLIAEIKWRWFRDHVRVWWNAQGGMRRFWCC